MKPLPPSKITKFLERFDDFKESEIRSLKIISPTEIEMIFAVQDKARAYDWIKITLLLRDLHDAKLIDESKLDYVDMSDGISMLHKEDLFYLGLGTCKTLTSIKDALLFVISENIKYNEGTF